MSDGVQDSNITEQSNVDTPMESFEAAKGKGKMPTEVQHGVIEDDDMEDSEEDEEVRQYDNAIARAHSLTASYRVMLKEKVHT